jgi:hypothetical protein
MGELDAQKSHDIAELENTVRAVHEAVGGDRGDIITSVLHLRDNAAAQSSRLSEFEKALRWLYTTIVGGEWEPVIDCPALCEAISKTVAGQLTRISELEAAIRSLQSFFVSGGADEPVDCKVDLESISKAFARLREERAQRQSRIAELEDAMKSLRSLFAHDESKAGVDCESDVHSISKAISGLRDDNARLQKELEELLQKLQEADEKFERVEAESGKARADMEVERTRFTRDSEKAAAAVVTILRDVAKTASFDEPQQMPLADVTPQNPYVTRLISQLTSNAHAAQRLQVDAKKLILAVKRQRELSDKDSQTIQQLKAELRDLQRLSPEVIALLAEIAQLSNFKPPDPMPISALSAYLTEFVEHLTRQNITNLDAIHKSQHENQQLLLLVEHQKKEMEKYAQTIQQGISDVAKAAGFLEPFSDPVDSYLSRLCEHLKATSHMTLRLKKAFAITRDEKIKLEGDLASRTAERDALHAKLQKLGAVMAQLETKSHGDADRYQRERSEVLWRLHSLLPGFSGGIPDDASLPVQLDKFLTDFGHAIAAEAIRRFSDPMSAIYSGMQSLVARIVGFQARIDGLLRSHQNLQQQHKILTQTSYVRDDSYRDLLFALFGTQQPELGNYRAIHEQVVKTQMILKSMFRLIPGFRLTPPDSIYLLALALRRQLESPTIIMDPEELVKEMPIPEVSAVKEHNSFISEMVGQIRKAMLLLSQSVMLKSVIPPLAEILGVNDPQETDEQLAKLMGEVKARIRVAEILTERVIQFHERIQTVIEGLEVSLPACVTGIIDTLKMD